MSSSANSILKLPTMATNTFLISLPSLTSKPNSHIQLSKPFQPSKNSFKFKNLSYSSFVSSISKKRFNLFALEEENSTIVLEDQENEVEGEGLKWENEEEEGGDVEAIGDEGEEFSEPPEDAKLFVGNLSFDVDSEKLAHLFEQAGVVEIAEVIYNRATDQSRGFGFVTMSTVEEAEKAVAMFNRYAAPRGSRPERAPREFEPSFRIYVGNLPWDVDNSRLEQIFSEHGKVVDARVVYDRESGRSRGFGFVRMASESDQNDAIANLDGQSLDGRTIRVNVAEERPRRF
ncbi:hypothetical protein Leryth_027512 [Lithospermum erythrorhizon]|nr:hypothetical protein Leryth_027512 [Lithospermum erythrorhizon]